MQDHAAGQIEAIHSMLATGHHSVRLERHSLILWGLTAASLIILINAVITPERFPIQWQRSLFSNSFITLVVTTIAFLDFRLTKLKRESRDEIVSFVQIQLTKVWWFLLGLIILINIGMGFFGGGYLFYPIMIILVGLGLYIQGLFSQQLLAWNGILMVLTGLGSIILQAPLQTLEWFTVVIFGMGMPVLAWLIDLPAVQKQIRYRLLSSLAWLCLVCIPTWMINQLIYQTNIPDWPVISLQKYQQLPTPTLENYIVHFPANTVIPLEVNIKGNTVANTRPSIIPMIMSQPFDVSVSNSILDGRYRVNGGNWIKPRQKYQIINFNLSTHLTNKDGPRIALDFFLKTED